MESLTISVPHSKNKLTFQNNIYPNSKRNLPLECALVSHGLGDKIRLNIVKISHHHECAITPSIIDSPQSNLPNITHKDLLMDPLGHINLIIPLPPN
jgi:hypothetical protein